MNIVKLLSEVKFGYFQSSGPGGQNVNKVATSVRLTFDINNSTALNSIAKNRLQKMEDKRISKDGNLTILARRFRSQEKNRVDALARFLSLIQKVSTPERKRRPTQPGYRAKENRIADKKKQSMKKKLRSTTNPFKDE